MTGETPVRQWSLGRKTLIVEPKSTTNSAFYGGLQLVFNADVPDSDPILNEAPPGADRFSSDRSIDPSVRMNGDVVDHVTKTAQNPFVPAGVRLLSRCDAHVVDFANRVALSSLAKVRFRFFEAASAGLRGCETDRHGSPPLKLSSALAVNDAVGAWDTNGVSSGA